MTGDNDGRPTLMMTTPGITQKRFTRDPLGTEAEMTPGDPTDNPWRSPEERERVEEAARMERGGQDGQLFVTALAGASDTGGENHPLHSNSEVGDPTEGNDPFAFDDLGPLGLPGLESIDPFNNDGPRF